MPRFPLRLLVLALTLVARAFLFPALATAQPHHGEAVLSAAERPEAGPSLFSVLWAETGSILEPNGTGTNSGYGTDKFLTGTPAPALIPTAE